MTDQNTPIEEVIERLEDLRAALEEAGAPKAAQAAMRYRKDFSSAARVRTSVQGLARMLEDWREHPNKVPDTATVQVAANVLEDECRAALKAGVIIPAPLTLQEQAERKARLAALTALGAVLFVGTLVVLFEAGLDVTDPIQTEIIPEFEVPQGAIRVIPIEAMERAADKTMVTGVRFAELNDCDGEERDGVSCAKTAEVFDWDTEEPITSFEARLTHQAYGLIFAFDNFHVRQALGYGRLRLAATTDTPQGEYLLRFQAVYQGYALPECRPWQHLLRQCPPPVRGDKAQHHGVPVAPLLVKVGPPSEADRLAAKERARRHLEAERKHAEERAEKILEMLVDIERALDVNDKVIRRKEFTEARERLGKLQVLFEPLDQLLSDPGNSGNVSQEVVDVRERLGDQQAALEAFEERVFDQMFEALYGDPNKPAPDSDAVVARIARKHGVEVAYVEEIYADRAEELQQRLKAQKQAHLEAQQKAEAALKAHCGPLKGGGWKEIEHYLKSHLEDEHVKVTLGECMSPLLTDQCWEVGCSYEKAVTIDVLHPTKRRDFQAIFHLERGKVKGYVPKKPGR